MISVIIGVVLGAIFAAFLFARVRYGSLRVSELPVLLLALLAGSEEKARLRLILSHRDMAAVPPTMPPAGPPPRPKQKSELVLMRTARECDCRACAAPLGIYHYRDTDAGNAYCFPCREQYRRYARETTETPGEQQ